MTYDDVRASLDLNDPVTENAVAEAIARLAPDATYVPLHVRYPWRFSETTGAYSPLVAPGRCGAPGFRLIINGEPQPPICSCDLRAGHAGQHEGRFYPPAQEGEITAAQVSHWDEPLIDAEIVDETEAIEEWCVQYRCPPGMTDWQVWQGSERHARRWAEVELSARLEEEFDQSVEYRIARRTVTPWEES